MLNTFEGALREVPVNVAMDFFFSSVLKVGFKKLLDNFSIQSSSDFFFLMIGHLVGAEVSVGRPSDSSMGNRQRVSGPGSGNFRPGRKERLCHPAHQRKRGRVPSDDESDNADEGRPRRRFKDADPGFYSLQQQHGTQEGYR